MTARYLLCPGLVLSRSDGDRHHVGASQLAALYGVAMAECQILPDRRHYPWLCEQLLARADRGEFIALHPRSNGDYRLPEARP